MLSHIRVAICEAYFYYVCAPSTTSHLEKDKNTHIKGYSKNTVCAKDIDFLDNKWLIFTMLRHSSKKRISFTFFLYVLSKTNLSAICDRTRSKAQILLKIKII